ELGTGPHVAAVRPDADRAVLRFHRGVRQVRDLVVRFDDLRRGTERRVSVAGVGRLAARGARQTAELLAQTAGVDAGHGTGIPLDVERVAPEPRRPEVIGDDRDAG